MNAFATTAACYEILSDSDARLEREGPFLRQVLDEAPGRRVVDLACGTGLHAAFFADLGAQVTALDLSTEMVTHARTRRPHPAITYRQGDMRRLCGGPWDVAVCLGNSLSLLPSHRDVEQTLAAVFDALVPGGLFALQLRNCEAAAARHPQHRIEKRQRADTEVVAIKSLVPHRDHALLALAFYAFTPGTCTTASETAVLLHLTGNDVTDMATRAGFHLAGRYGGFDQRPFDASTSPDVVCLLRRP